jgi:hypothetical protein
MMPIAPYPALQCHEVNQLTRRDGLGWFWNSKNGRSDPADGDESEEDILQSQLSSEINADDLTQTSPLLQKKKRSRASNGDSEVDREGQKNKKTKTRKQNKSLENDIVSSEDLDNAIADVLAKTDGMVKDKFQPSLKQTIKPTSRSKGKPGANKAPIASGHGDSEDSDSDDDDIPAKQIESKTTQVQALKDSSASTGNRRTSFAAANQAALLASITKSGSRSSTENVKLEGEKDSIRPPRRSARVVVLESSQPRKLVSRAKLNPSSEDTDSDATSDEESDAKSESESDTESRAESIQNSDPKKTADEPMEMTDVYSSSEESAELESENNLAGSKKRSSSGLGQNPSTTATSRENHRWKKVGCVPVLPEGYKRRGPKEYWCPVTGCDKVYTRRTTLGSHQNVSIFESQARKL